MRELGKLLTLNLAISLFIVLISAANMRNPRPERLFWPFTVSMVYSTSIGGLAWWLLPRLAPRITSPNATWRYTQILVLLTLIGLTGGNIGYVILSGQPWVNFGVEYRQSMYICVMLTWIFGGISYLVESARLRLEASTLELRTRELEKQKALQAATDARLRSLESRIHPHFLFNTLNSISSLVRSNPTEAEATIERLAALLRFSLDRHGNLVSLADELQITRDYLEIERTRFGDRLRYSIDIDPALESTQVPALSIQTLAENSVKYAVSTQRAGADIRITAARTAEGVQLAVTDSGPGFSPDSLPSGHGLDTLQGRLDSVFGDRASLSTRRLDPGMEVAFRVPC